MSVFEYDAPPTCAAYMKCESFGRIIAGPVGSGKTTCNLVEMLRRAIQQAPALDGIRYTRFAIVRQTLKQLKDTVLKDCKEWFKELGYWKVSDGAFYINFEDVNSEFIFIPLEDADDQARLLSMNLTGAFLSECIEMNLDVVRPVSARCGRFPRGKTGTPSWHGILADTNMPAELSPWWQFMEVDLPSDWQLFKQPSGLALPDRQGRGGAENLNWLVQNAQTINLPIDHPGRLAQGRKYYERMVAMYGEDSDFVKRYVKAQYGDDPSGLAVFRQSFKANFHCADETLLIPGYPIIVGQDFGRNPWSLICQPDHQGRLIVHEEVPAENIGLEKHLQERLRPRLMQDKYFGFKVAVVGDPAGVAKGTIGEETSFEVIKRCGLPAVPAPTNDIDPRIRAVEALLGQQTNGGPTLIINRHGCPKLVRAMSGGYRFTKMKTGQVRAVPDKNDPEGYSHVADALQYACLVVHGGLMHEIARRLNVRKARKRAPMSAAAWT